VDLDHPPRAGPEVWGARRERVTGHRSAARAKRFAEERSQADEAEAGPATAEHLAAGTGSGEGGGGHRRGQSQ
jgi:hypothetical protein